MTLVTQASIEVDGGSAVGDDALMVAGISSGDGDAQVAPTKPVRRPRARHHSGSHFQHDQDAGIDARRA